MARIIIGIALIFLSINIQAQNKLSLLFSDEGYAISNFEVQNYSNAMTTKLQDEQLERLDIVVSMLKDSLSIDSLSKFFDVILFFANQTSEAGLKNLVKRSNDADIGAQTVVFTQWEGFISGDATGYIHLDYNPSSDAVNYLIGSASIGVYSRTDNDVAVSDIGVFDGTNFSNLSRNTNVFIFRINADASTTTTASTDGRGMFIASRTASNLTTPYINGVAGTTTTELQRTLVNLDFYIFAANAGSPVASTSGRQLSFVFVAKGINATQARKITNCIEWYMDDLGKGVIP